MTRFGDGGVSSHSSGLHLKIMFEKVMGIALADYEKELFY